MSELLTRVRKVSGERFLSSSLMNLMGGIIASFVELVKSVHYTVKGMLWTKISIIIISGIISHLEFVKTKLVLKCASKKIAAQGVNKP